MTEKKVYIVTSGVYSDYRINAVFSTKTQAEAFVKLYATHYSYFEPIKVETYLLDLSLEDWYTTIVKMTREGHVIEVSSGFGSPPRDTFITDMGHLYSEVAGSDEERAIKVTNERRTAMLIAGAWDKWDADHRNA